MDTIRNYVLCIYSRKLEITKCYLKFGMLSTAIPKLMVNKT